MCIRLELRAAIRRTRLIDMLTYSFSPSSRSATSIDEFLAVCQAEPSVAADHLRRGYFEPWLRDTGHTELAAAAARARDEDGDALHQFLLAAAPRAPGSVEQAGVTDVDQSDSPHRRPVRPGEARGARRTRVAPTRCR